jgi:hypothetical protein
MALNPYALYYDTLIPYQNKNPKSLRADYIYLIFGEKAKGQTPRNEFAPYEKRYHKYFRPLIFTLSLQ